jgi:chromosome partitioning protein
MVRFASMSAPAAQAHVITVLNLKGGVGKTHTAWLLASVAEERGLRMLAIDTDPQGNLSNSFVRSGSKVPGVERLFDPSAEADVHSLIRRTQYGSIDIIPASAALVRFDLSDQRAWEQSDLHRCFVDPVRELRMLYDLVVFDCPPRLSLVSFAALCASDFVIVPLEAADWGAQGIKQVTAAIDYVQSRFNNRLQLLGYLVSRFKRSRAYQQTYLAQLRAHFGPKTFDTVISDLAEFERSVTDAVLVTRHAASRTAARLARQFFDETARRCEELRGAGRRGSTGRVPDTGIVPISTRRRQV